MISVAILLSGCSASKREPLRIGVNFWVTSEFIVMAQDKGYFDEEGIPLELVEYSSLADCRRGFERGQVDALASTLVEVLMSRDASQRRPQVVQVIDFSNGADFIVAKPSVPDVAALKGRRVGAETDSLGIFVLGRALEQAKLRLTDITIVSKDQSAMARAYASGEVDAAVTYPPFSVGLFGPSADGHIIFNSSEIPGEVVDVIEVDARKLEDQDAARIQRVWKRILAHVNENPDASYREMAKRERIDLSEFKKTMAGITVVTPELQRELIESGRIKTTLQKTAQFLHEAGVLKNEPDTAEVLAPLYR